MKEHRTKVVVLAGGQGSRFWPMSRAKKPKQFLKLGNSDESLLQATVSRVESLVGKDDLLVISNEQLKPLIHEHVSWAKVLCEPSARNTAPCIGLAAHEIAKEDPDCVMIVLPADHAVSNEPGLLSIFREASAIAAKSDVLVTLGIPPEYAHTGYGYIKRGAKYSGNAYKVNRFFEKPSLERALKYIESKDYYWNSGMFVWRARTILKAFEEHLPELSEGLKIYDRLSSEGKISEAAEVFSKLESISIDFGVLEHAKNSVVIEAKNLGWNDVGSWDAWAAGFKHDEQGNHTHGESLLIDCENCVVHSSHKLTAVVGGKDLIVIDSGDALLVCPRESVQEVRKVVEELRKKGRFELV